jgi:hypothetical protein
LAADLPDDGQISQTLWMSLHSLGTLARQNRLREKSNFVSRFNVIWVVQSLSAKIFRLSRRANHRH